MRFKLARKSGPSVYRTSNYNEVQGHAIKGIDEQILAPISEFDVLSNLSTILRRHKATWAVHKSLAKINATQSYHNSSCIAECTSFSTRGGLRGMTHHRIFLVSIPG